MQIGNAYRAFARDETDLFHLMLGRVDRAYRPAEAVKAQASVLLEMVVVAIGKATAAGHLRAVDPATVALSTWATVHGFVTLEINGFIEDCTPAEADAMFAESLRVLFEGLGHLRSSHSWAVSLR